MNKTFAIVICLLLFSHSLTMAQDNAFDQIIKAIEESDAKSLSAHFSTTIELRLPGNENTYSSSQAEMIMKDFFKRYPPDTFKTVQEGSTEETSKFAICSYISGSRQFQVYLYLKREKDQFLLQKIKFEEIKP